MLEFKKEFEKSVKAGKMNIHLLGLKFTGTTDEEYVDYVLKSGVISGQEFTEYLSKYTGFKMISSVSEIKLSDKVYECNIKELKSNHILTLMDSNDNECLLCVNPFRANLAELMNSIYSEDETGSLKIMLCTNELIEEYYSEYSNLLTQITMGTATISTRDEIKVLFRKIMNDSIKQRASDIRIGTYDNGGIVIFRIDGEIVQYKMLTEDVYYRLVKYILYDGMSQINGNNASIPRTGLMTIKLSGEKHEFRMNIEPGKFGVDLNFRETIKKELSLNNLGLSEHREQLLRSFTDIKSGLVLFTGAVGTGKSTSIYALISPYKDTKVIATVEDPVEHKLNGVLQLDISDSITYADGIKSFLRHDTDIIVVGEIRDSDVAKNSIQASQTGVLVLSSLHTRSAFGAIERLRGLGISNMDIADNLQYVVNQNLVKRPCECATEEEFTKQEVYGAFGKECTDTSNIKVLRSTGCPKCNNTGGFGRLVVTEILKVTDELRKDILENKSIFYLKENHSVCLETYADDILQNIENKRITLDEGLTKLQELE